MPSGAAHPGLRKADHPRALERFEVRERRGGLHDLLPTATPSEARTGATLRKGGARP